MPLVALADALTQAGIEVEHLEPPEAGASTGSILTLKIPPNRGDCLSVEGLAREVSAITQSPFKALKVESQAPSLSDNDKYPIQVLASQACPSFSFCVLRNFDNTVATPPEILEALKIAGIASSDILSDILHYVMLELGQPLQAFDLQRLVGPLVIRKAQASESIKISDDRTLRLEAEALVMSDQKNIQALAGVVGSSISVVRSITTEVLLSSAVFDPIAIRQLVQRYGVHSEASYRFERGIDPALPLRALERALALIVQRIGANIGIIHTLSQKEDITKYPAQASTIFLARKQIEQCLGVTLDDQEVISLFQRLNMQVMSQADGFSVQPPSYRLDLKISVDLIEELCRIYGLDRIPAVDFCGRVKAPILSDHTVSDRSLKEVLINRGYCEIITYSFIDPVWIDHLGFNTKPLRLANPISSEMAVMRSSLWPGLLTALQYNQNRQIKRARLFEMGACFMDEEVPMLAGLCVGSVEAEEWGWTQWKLKERQHDFYDVKRDIEALLSLQQDPIRFEPVENPTLQEGQRAAIYRMNQRIGVVGALHPRILKSLDLQGPVWLFEIKRSAFCAAIPSFVPLSKFPSVRRDLALVISKTVSAEALKQSVIANAGEWLQKVFIFDAYESKTLGVQQKSVALALLFQHPSRTLEEAEIKMLVDRVVEGLTQPPFQARLRE